jgi:hypothetical protein
MHQISAAFKAKALLLLLYSFNIHQRVVFFFFLYWNFILFYFLFSFFFYYSYVPTRIGSFLPTAPTPSLTTHSVPSLSPPTPKVILHHSTHAQGHQCAFVLSISLLLLSTHWISKCLTPLPKDLWAPSLPKKLVLGMIHKAIHEVTELRRSDSLP